MLAFKAFTEVCDVELHRADREDLRTEAGRLVLYIDGKGHQEKDKLVGATHPDSQVAIYAW